MATFDIYPLERFAGGGQTTIRRPREFAHFSFDHEHKLKTFSAESLCYYYPPVLGAPGASEAFVDLSAGFQSFNKRDDSVDEHLDALLDTLQAHEERLLEHVKTGDGDIQDVRVRAHVITWRGMMTKVCLYSPVLNDTYRCKCLTTTDATW